MASGWLFQAIYASLLSQALDPSSPTAPLPSKAWIPSQRPEVETSNGRLGGVRATSSSGVLVDSYLGIPFAKPPVGQLRFSKPIAASSWAGTRDASRFGSECFQRVVNGMYQVADEPLPRTEDCLYLNVYKPLTNSKGAGLLPVMVWIHGGSYYLGAGSHYDGTDLAANGVIVVTINYRLDIFGFLANEDAHIPGNYGMLDQIMALRWVKDNIKSFNGDPDKVTIFGESSGSTSVSLLLISPLSKGLFSGAIMESGVSLSPWAINHPTSRLAPHHFVNLVGASVGCIDWDSAKKIQCFRSLDAESLFNASLAVEDALGGGMILTPVVENTFGFLPDLPIRLWTSNKFNQVNTIRGFNTAESGDSILYRDPNSPFTNQSFIDGMTQFFKPYGMLDKDRLIKEILDTYYTGDVGDKRKRLMNYVHAKTDMDFTGPTLVEANIQSKLATRTKHYVYEFEHRRSSSYTPTWMPATHGGEVPFVFGVDIKPFKVQGKAPSPEDIAVEKQMQTYWANFAAYGEPIPRSTTSAGGTLHWNPYRPGSSTVLKISNSSKEVSYEGHRSVILFGKVIRKLDTEVIDSMVIG